MTKFYFNILAIDFGIQIEPKSFDYLAHTRLREYTLVLA